MEGIEKAFRGVMSQDPNSNTLFSSISAALQKPTIKSSASVSSSADQSQLLITRSSKRVISLWTCSKLGAFCFVAGVFVGYTLKRRVHRWASKLLRGLKD